jgi:hypothetical protein
METTMEQKTFSLTAGIVFALVALGHLWRIAQGWEITANGTMIPMWVSWVALVITAILAFYGLRFGARQ